MRYTNAEVQQIIDDLDFAQIFFSEESEVYIPDFAQVRQSLKNASDILCDLPDEVVESMDKTPDVFVQTPRKSAKQERCTR